MASPTSRSSARIRDKDKHVRGTGGKRDNPESFTRSSRTPHRAKPPQPQPIIFNFNGDVQITKGSMFGRAPDEDLGQLQRSRPALPAVSNGYVQNTSRTRTHQRIIAVGDESAEENSEASESDREYSSENESSHPPSVLSAASTSKQRVQTWQQQDSGYDGSTRGSSREKNAAYKASLSRRAPSTSAEEETSSHSKQTLKPPRTKSNGGEGTNSDHDETHLATKRDDEGENSDDSDDDFQNRRMKVATIDNKQLDVRVILDTGTKPNWISSRFLTESLRRKYTRLSDEEAKQEYSDFNGNKFNGIGKAELMIISNDFTGFSGRNISFLVAKGGSFQILLGSRTIKEERLLCKPLDPQREGAFPAVQMDPKKAERAKIEHSKEKQKREGVERDKLREEARKAKRNEKKMSNPTSSSSAARFAQEVKPQRRRERSPSPLRSRNIQHPVRKIPETQRRKTNAPLYEGSSSSSSLDGGAAI